MSYSTGMLNKRIRIARRSKQSSDKFGGKPNYEWLGWFNAGETWSKGVKSLQEGALEAYDTVMFRLRYHDCIDRWCIIWCEGTYYQILSFHSDYHENTIQITAQELASPDSLNIIEPSES